MTKFWNPTGRSRCLGQGLGALDRYGGGLLMCPLGSLVSPFLLNLALRRDFSLLLMVEGLGGVSPLPDYRQCPTCGQLNRELARFCRECGSSLGSSSQKESSGRTASNVTGPLVHEDNRTRSTDDVAQPGPRGPRRRLPVALLALTLFAAVLALAGWQTGWPPAVFGARHVTAPRAARSASPPPSQVADSTASSSLPSPSPSASGIPATSHS